MDEKEKQTAKKILDRILEILGKKETCYYDGLQQFIYDELKAIQVQAEVSPMLAEWISAKDRLPESGTMFLMYNNMIINGKYAIRFFVDGSYYDGDGRSTDQIFTKENFTHWMPLPEPPKQ